MKRQLASKERALQTMREQLNKLRIARHRKSTLEPGRVETPLEPQDPTRLPVEPEEMGMEAPPNPWNPEGLPQPGISQETLDEQRRRLALMRYMRGRF